MESENEKILTENSHLTSILSKAEWKSNHKLIKFNHFMQLLLNQMTFQSLARFFNEYMMERWFEVSQQNLKF